jgi:NAD(P)H dehydrogenase (quinone)
MHEMANAVADGAREVSGTDVRLRRIQEFDAVEKVIDGNEYMRQVRDRQSHIPVCTVDDLREADGMLFGSPTRFGNMTAQMKQLFDSAGSLWLKGELEGKPAGVFTSTASTHGGQETTLLSMMIPLLHLGAIIVGVPYSYVGMIHTDARGGTPYGASTIAGPMGELKPKPEDLELARLQGHRVAMITSKLRG